MKSLFNPGDIISYAEMSLSEGVSLQKGMNFRIKGNKSIILMSLRKGAPYADRIEDDGKILIYEGHDVPSNEAKIPKAVDQQMHTPNKTLTENGKFYQEARKYHEGMNEPELVKVYEKIKKGIWSYNGVFQLVDAWLQKEDGRNVFKFRLHVTDVASNYDEETVTILNETNELEHNRIIPTSVKLEVWKRDKGKCIECGSMDNLHFDHILPFSKGGTSLLVENIQLLCARHNLQKHDKIQ